MDIATSTLTRKLESLSVVVPGLNEADNLPILCEELLRHLGPHGFTLEILFIDDGSTDRTLDVCRDLHVKHPQFQYISLSRNFGHQRALTAGLDIASGQAIAVMDADLQDPPEVVLEMIREWEQGFDVLYGQRRSRTGETFFKKFTAKMFYRVLQFVSNVKIPEDTGDFRLMDRKVVDQLKRLRERGRFMRGLVSWVGFKQKAVMYDRMPRHLGFTKYPFLRMLTFAWEGITSFSVMPLRLATLTGFAFSMSAFLMVLYYVLRKTFIDDFAKGWASVMAAIFLVSGVQMLFIGIIGEYLAKIFEESKERPLYIVKECSRPFTDQQ